MLACSLKDELMHDDHVDTRPRFESVCASKITGSKYIYSALMISSCQGNSLVILFCFFLSFHLKHILL